jgi:hypothetical protein
MIEPGVVILVECGWKEREESLLYSLLCILCKGQELNLPSCKDVGSFCKGAFVKSSLPNGLRKQGVHISLASDAIAPGNGKNEFMDFYLLYTVFPIVYISCK